MPVLFIENVPLLWLTFVNPPNAFCAPDFWLNLAGRTARDVVDLLDPPDRELLVGRYELEML